MAGRWDPTSPGWVYTTYLIGSVNFFIASSIMLWLWKEEQYGLGFIPSINRIVPLRPASEGKGYRQVSLWHFAFIQVYITLTGASFIDFCFATQRFSVYEQYHGFAHFHEAVASLMGVFLAVGLLFMGSVLHTTPRNTPVRQTIVLGTGVRGSETDPDPDLHRGILYRGVEFGREGGSRLARRRRLHVSKLHSGVKVVVASK